MRMITGLFVLTLTATPALAEEWDFMLTNDAGKPIKTIELAPAGSTDFKPQLLDEEQKREPVIKVKAKTTVRFDKAEKQCRYDIRATFEDATTQIWSAANICDNSYITLKLAGGKATVSAN